LEGSEQGSDGLALHEVPVHETENPHVVALANYQKQLSIDVAVNVLEAPASKDKEQVASMAERDGQASSYLVALATFHVG